MPHMRRVAVVVVLLAVCGSATLAEAKWPDGTLRVRQVVKQSPEGSPPYYIEGFVLFIRLRNADGQILVEERHPARGGRMVVNLRAGTYRVTSFLRPCQGNCEYLDPPADRCSRRVRFHDDRRETIRARVTVRPGHGCKIRLRRSPGLSYGPTPSPAR